MWIIPLPDDQRDDENNVTQSLGGSLCLIMRENPCYVSKERIRAALEPVLTQPLQLEQEPTLQHSTTTSLGGRWAEPLFCIPLFQCIHIQKMLVVHWLEPTTWPSTSHYFIFRQKNHDLFW